jgi:hypothetical protein
MYAEVGGSRERMEEEMAGIRNKVRREGREDRDIE